MTTWILSAQRAGARIFTHTPKDGLTLLEEIPHDKGRLQDGDIDTDKSGYAIDGSGGHSMERPQSPSERVAADFARSLAGRLETERLNKSFDDLLLVASPQMLGLIRKSLDPSTSSMIRASIDKEYLADDQERLERALSEYIKL